MSALSVEPPFPAFAGADGQPLDDGYIWIGVQNLSPQTNPVNVYFDRNLTILAPQPLRTINGYISNSGSPAQVYVNGADFSILVQDSNGSLVYSFEKATGDISGAFGVSVKEFGAVGDGITNDTSAFNAAKTSAGDYGYVTPNGEYNVGPTAPDYNLNGVGKLLASGVSTGGTQLTYNPARESAFFNPDTYQREVQGINYPPPRGTDYITSSYNVVFSPGSKLNDYTKNIRYNVVFGDLIGSTPGAWGYNNVFGSNAMAYAYNVNRNTVIGSESMAWAGAPDQAWLVTYQHDWWRKPPDNPFVPGEPGWDAAGLETNFPGIGARIAAYSAYPTSETETSFNSTLGRNAGNHMIKGIRNTYVGYRAAGQNFVGSFNTVVGSLAMDQAVFADFITAVGDQAGRDCLDSLNATFVGYAAGRTVQNASDSVIIGDRAADEVLDATDAVIIGALAGASHPTNLNDKLVISNARSTLRDPLISGRFTDEVAGVAIQPEALRAKWHVQAATSGSALTPVAGLLVEGATQASLTLETNDSGFPGVRFADTASNNVGFVEYSHGSNTMTFGTNAGSRFRLESDGIPRPWTDNSISLGRAAFRWSEVFAGNAIINTSDSREKQQVRDLLDAERAVALRIKKLIKAFKWNDAVQTKGDKARIHFGVIAQDVKAAFEAEGLNADDYGMFCYDEWGDEFENLIDEAGNQTGKKKHIVVAGNRYGIRYEELLAFVIGAM